MDASPAVFFTLLFLLPFFLLITRRRRRTSRNLPPGSLGIPFIGQSFALLKAMRTNQAENWIRKRIENYGSISKLNLFGSPAVLLVGPAANKFIFTASSNILTNEQPKSIQMLMGSRNLLQLVGEDHKRLRNALGLFLRPEVLKKYVGTMDAEVKYHIEKHWRGKANVTVLPLMKRLTFDIICTLLFGVEKGAVREEMVKDFQVMIEGMWAVPVNLPFTRFRHSLKASMRVRRRIQALIGEKRLALEQGLASPQQDLITSLLDIRGDGSMVTDEEIIDNVILVMAAGHDTSSVLITFMMQQFADNPVLYSGVVDEQEEIARSKAHGEPLTWDDLTKMKQTWKAAMETLRVVTPVFGSFRSVLKDIEYGGYLIPKGWKIFWVSSSTHMDEKIYPEPWKFDHARFDNQVSATPYSFVAFGGGARICPGYEFAKIETLVTIHHIVTQFKWKLCYTDRTIVRDPMPTPPQGMPIELEAKKN